MTDAALTDTERANADKLLGEIETAVGEIMPRDRNAALIKQIIEAANGLRSLLSVLRPH